MRLAHLIGSGIAACISTSLAFAQEAKTTTIDQPQRLSEWLQASQQPEDAYSLGLMWKTPEDLQRQKKLHNALEEDVKSLFQSNNLMLSEVKAFDRMLSIFQPTGRVRTFAAESKWLEASPSVTRNYARVT